MLGLQCSNAKCMFVHQGFNWNKMVIFNDDKHIDDITMFYHSHNS